MLCLIARMNNGPGGRTPSTGSYYFKIEPGGANEGAGEILDFRTILDDRFAPTSPLARSSPQAAAPASFQEMKKAEIAVAATPGKRSTWRRRQLARLGARLLVARAACSPPPNLASRGLVTTR
jgi:hypothetical protein